MKKVNSISSDDAAEVLYIGKKSMSKTVKEKKAHAILAHHYTWK